MSLTDAAIREIPVIDIGPALDGTGEAQVVEQLRWACTEVGFLQIVGHGVPMGLLERVHETVAALAALPAEEKAALAPPSGHRFRGIAIKRDGAGREQNESLQVNSYENAEAAVADGVNPQLADYFAPNVWPDLIPGVRESWRECSTATRALGRRLMQLFALALGVPRDTFDGCFRRDVTQFGVNWYPPQPVADESGPRLLGIEHADSGVLTVLHQQGQYEGLQVRDRDGSWITVPIVPGAFVINIGELMNRWTNDTWPATVHRVVAGPEGLSRSSVVTFMLPAVDTLITPLPATVGEDGAKFEAVTPYEWESAYIRRLGFAAAERGRPTGKALAGQEA